MNDILLPKLGFVRHLNIGLRFAFTMSLLCGVIYMISITQLGALLFPLQAQGSIVKREGVTVGSALIAQPFTSEKYFYGRPSATAYDAKNTAGSNLAQSNPALHARAKINSDTIQKIEGVDTKNIPIDLISASGSGVDPHITPASAFLQATRIAKARGIHEAVVIQLIKNHIEGPQWGLFGQERVNVLKLNLALDKG